MRFQLAVVFLVVLTACVAEHTAREKRPRQDSPVLLSRQYRAQGAQPQPSDQRAEPLP